MWKYEAEMSAVGDPHITSIWGCRFEADKKKTEEVLMSCDKDELKIRYSKSWSYHIFEVETKIDDVVTVYHHSYLKHAQRKRICGNTIEFHRYFSGINVRVVELQNDKISGLFNNSRCVTP